jgi:hypothetical protein
MSRSSQRLPLDMTSDEERCGFSVTEAPSGVRAVVRELSAGLRAVKVEADDGSVVYAICDEYLRPLYQAAKSLRELRQRFGHKPHD